MRTSGCLWRTDKSAKSCFTRANPSCLKHRVLARKGRDKIANFNLRLKSKPVKCNFEVICESRGFQTHNSQAIQQGLHSSVMLIYLARCWQTSLRVSTDFRHKGFSLRLTSVEHSYQSISWFSHSICCEGKMREIEAVEETSGGRKKFAPSQLMIHW